MTGNDHELAAALAAADQQLSHVNGGLDLVVEEAQKLLGTHGVNGHAVLLVGGQCDLGWWPLKFLMGGQVMSC